MILLVSLNITISLTGTLFEISLDIQSCNCTYKLMGATEYIDRTNKNDIGHYIVYCH